MTDTIEIGAKGEKAAISYLRRNGFLIRERNWRNGRYEIDIIAEKLGVVHFVEVKTRRVGSLTTPEMAISKQKFTSLRRAATAYIAFNVVRYEHQYDLVAVDIDGDNIVEIRYIENAMQYSW